jgi:hypothetical protein
MHYKKLLGYQLWFIVENRCVAHVICDATRNEWQLHFIPQSAGVVASTLPNVREYNKAVEQNSAVKRNTSTANHYSTLPKASQSAFNQNHLEQKMFQPNMESKPNHITAIKILSA